MLPFVGVVVVVPGVPVVPPLGMVGLSHRSVVDVIVAGGFAPQAIGESRSSRSARRSVNQIEPSVHSDSLGVAAWRLLVDAVRSGPLG